MGFLDNLKKNNFKSISERAISNLQNKDNQNTEKKVEKVSTTETSGITKQSDLSKAGLANTAMGQNESNTHKKNYFNDTFINPNKKILGENMFNTVENKNVKEILESMILQEDLLGFVERNRGKVGVGAGLAAGAAAHAAYTKSGIDSGGKFLGEKAYEIGNTVKNTVKDTISGVKSGYDKSVSKVSGATGDKTVLGDTGSNFDHV